ncbi:hypothetical protein F4677DRAFT_388371 [Hypoxylon crocopeplum]|nr:hypothetical protein F4677DRAFT_388371 [Hypoxylon crocopeplum]
MGFLALPTSLLLSILLQTQVSSSQLQNDFSSYPQGSQGCLNDAADQAQCSGNTGQELNECLCSNHGNFIYNTAQCVAKKSPNDLNAVYDTMQTNCAGTGVTIAVSKDAFMSQAAAATSTTSSTSATSTSTSSSTSSPSSTTTHSPSATPTATGTAGIPTATKIGLGAGIGFGAIALGLLAWFVWAYSRRRRRSPTPSTHAGDHDVELSDAGNNTFGGGSKYAASSSYPSPLSPPVAEYAQHNNQYGAAELGVPAHHHEWKELPAGYYDGEGGSAGGGTGVKSEDKRASDVPLLSELGADEALRTPSSGVQQQQQQQSPVELPADSRYDDHDNHDPQTDRGYRSHGYGYGRGDEG